MKNNISILSDCYGCGVCTKICPVNIIDLVEAETGFYRPTIVDESKCIECGLCLKTCGFYNSLEENDNENTYHIGWTKNSILRKKCSSGGITQEIIKFGIESGYNICAAKYDAETNRVSHSNFHELNDSDEFIGSKYIQSNTQDALRNINLKEKNIVVGMPCQIDSLRRLIRIKRCENNFILVDFFCHGVPSLKMWDKYLANVESKIGKILKVSWRNKDMGWKRSYCIKASGEKGNYKSLAIDGDLFYKLFLGNYCLNHCCYHSCKYKQANSSADIRVGDCWGISRKDENEGISCVIAFSGIGENLLKNIGQLCHIEDVNPEMVLKGQMKRCAKLPFVYPIVYRALNSQLSLSQIYKKYIFLHELIFRRPRVIWLKIKTILGKR